MNGSSYPAVAIVGPTASGKSQLAERLAGLFAGEIVSCDALQIYRGMDIGTAKPGREERMEIPHHMLDLRNPDEAFSAGDYQRLAREALRDIRARARVPFVAGGTGFYLRALIDGLFDGPGRSEDMRARMRRIVELRGSEYLHNRLRRVDPTTASRIAPADASRVIRAYELYLRTGRTMQWWQRQARNSLHGFRWLKLGIRWQRARLYERIDARVEEMFRLGFVDEVRRLLQNYPTHCHAFKAIGYRQIVDHLEDRLTLAQAIAATQQHTRNYAKRQLTWFRADRTVVWLEAVEDLADTAREAECLTSRFLQIR